ncbi:MAG: SIS domain-containing protein, partial [Micrococcales bacterium]|nr:SIS domain-containing protein [Micrococcales bacterium]
QRVFASRLGQGDVCLVLSATGADPDSLAAARAAAEAGARVLALTSFAESPLVETAHLALVVPSSGATLRWPAEPDSRLAHALVLEALVDAVARRRVPSPLSS